MPRGYIHQVNYFLNLIFMFVFQGETGNAISHHVTFSVARKFTFSEMLKQTFEEIVDYAAVDNIDMRTSLPPYVLDAEEQV